MIYELNKTDYERVHQLFKPLAEYLTFCAAVLEGTQAGQVFVDDVAVPRSAFMITRDVWAYLAGNPHNDPFNQALNKAIYARQVVGEDAFGLLLHCHPDDWQAALKVVAKPRQPIPAARRRYIGRALQFDWQTHVPDGFTIQWADHTLLDRPGLELPRDVKNMLETRGPDGDPMQKGFGFVALHEDGTAGTASIAAHAVIDSIADGVGDIGLVTSEGFRRRGLATATVAAAVAYGLSHGLAMVNWDCGASNIGSLRTAEKLGFERERDHTMYIIDYDET
jgi:GNAT superfamily N-acetyltransferase